LCHENKSDIDEIKSDYLDGLVSLCKEMSEVEFALTDQKVKNAKRFRRKLNSNFLNSNSNTDF
jgi:ATP-dependent Lon protease